MGVTEHILVEYEKGKYTEFDMENNQIKRGVDTMCKIHNIENDLSWLYVRSSKFLYLGNVRIILRPIKL